MVLLRKVQKPRRHALPLQRRERRDPLRLGQSEIGAPVDDQRGRAPLGDVLHGGVLCVPVDQSHTRDTREREVQVLG